MTLKLSANNKLAYPVYRLRYSLIVIAFFFIIISNAGTANAQPSFANVIPPPPEAAAIEKFVDQPVDLYRGVPQINIPIWNIKQKGISLPISLNYHAGGIKVEETPSWVGAGWGLLAGGSITRTIKGAPDDANTGFASTNNIVPVCPNDYTYDTYYNAEQGSPDWEPDVFSYSCPAGSGKFVLDQQGIVHQIPQTNLKIIVNRVSGRFDNWTITGMDGVVYEFKKYDQAFSSLPSPGINYSSSWYLTAIRSPTLNPADDITLNYQSYTSENQQFSSETIADRNNWSSFANLTITQSQAWRLSQINFSGGSINFLPGVFRHDLKGGQTLSSIQIKDINNTVVKTFNFNYNYFGNGAMVEFSGLTPATATTTANTTLRLSLKSIQELDANNAAKPPYQFVYESSVWLPDRLNSKAIDHWGYYNGKTTNTTLIPRFQYGFVNGVPLFNNLADRNPNETFSKAGMLNKIIYPTGGYTNYTYEGNRVSTSYYQLDYTPQYLNYTMAVSPCNVSPEISFSVNDYSANGVTFNASFQGYVPPGNSPTCSGNSTPISPSTPQTTNLFFKIFKTTDLQNPVYFSSGQMIIDGTTKSATDNIGLPNGNYILRICKYSLNSQALSSDATTTGSYSFTMSGIQYVNSGYKLAGGLRVKEILETDPIANSSVDKVYEYLNQYGTTSGTLNMMPKYDYSMIITDNNGAVYNAVTTRTAVSRITGDDDGVAYSKVTVYNGQNAQTHELGTDGKTEYLYSVPMDYISSYSAGGNMASWGYTNLLAVNSSTSVCYKDDYVNSTIPIDQSEGVTFPFAPAISQSWRRGMLLQQLTYSKVNGNYILIDGLTNSYKDDYYGSNALVNHSTDVLGARVATFMTDITSTPPANSKGIQYYYYQSRLNKLISTSKVIYDAAGQNPVTTSVNYDYSNLEHQQITQKTVANSKGDNLITVYKYPVDYSTPQVYQDMYTRHIWSPIIEQLNYKNSLSNFLNSTRTNYGEWGNVIMPSSLDTKVGTNNYSTRLDYYNYDNQGNETEIGKDSGPHTCYVWSYGGQFPIAKIDNAIYSNVVTALGGSTAIETFKNNAYPTDAQVKSFLAPLFTNTNLAGAQITSYTCNPLIGVTSVTDTKGQTTYYEYDSFQRLMNIKDKDGNIIKSFTYHYQGQ